MFRHTMLFLGHELGNLRRNPAWPILGIMQPVLYLLLFAPLLTSITPNGTLEEALVVFTPAALMMIALFGSMFAGFGMINETRNGVLERLAVSQAWRPAIILGRVAKDMIMLVLQSLVILGVAALMGLRIGLPAMGLMLLLMAVTGLFAANLSYGLALAVRDENGMSQIVQFFLLPLMLLSGLMLPMSVAPDWMQTAARFNPLYYAVEAGRAMFAGDYSDSTIPTAFGLFLVLGVLTLTWSVRSLRKLAG
ncbi:ABC transporter permease [Planomonospora sp. ID91781]|uniref:Transport permease protein n=3 Tax=Planomonospora TaxID=1998 RepID=A0A171BT06_9ACTN|nr:MULTISPECIES: ABC transporter permease [Planomonospora]MBG0821305.1 ABC transporter permease [Planomonospora sp. ID91781]GAT65522.1 ABC transporter [Planomonospora sphaerica]GGK74832.1 transport permease protein [Planomonospora parontospora]GII09539.1 transport permease protein [Planomonospora parontospora subsp. parontospora]